MVDLACHCPETGKPVDLQFGTDGSTLARIWSSEVRFRCPHCGNDHETLVRKAYIETVRSSGAARDNPPP